MIKFLSIATVLTVLFIAEEQAQAVKWHLPECLQNIKAKFSRKAPRIQKDNVEQAEPLLNKPNLIMPQNNSEYQNHINSLSRKNTVISTEEVQPMVDFETLLKRFSALKQDKTGKETSKSTLSQGSIRHWMTFLDNFNGPINITNNKPAPKNVKQRAANYNFIEWANQMKAASQNTVRWLKNEFGKNVVSLDPYNIRYSFYSNPQE